VYYEGQHPGYFFGGRQHEGRLSFVESDKAYAEFLRLSALVPTVFVTTLERPLILTNVKPHPKNESGRWSCPARLGRIDIYRDAFSFFTEFKGFGRAWL